MGRRRIRIDLAYDGAGFAGWQFQPRQRTVQGTVEEALTRLQGGSRVRLRAAGRTDAGAHARQQVADCEIDCRLDDARLAHALGRVLPPDVKPLAVRTVDRRFDAQRDARRKTYRYRLDRTPHADPFLARYALHWPHELDEASVRGALRQLVGRHEWSAFADSRCRIGDRVREMYEAAYEATSAAECWFTFTADGFLTYMVRNIVGTLLEVARGRLTAADVERILVSGDRRLAGATAAARGLVLWRVVYADRPTPPAGSRIRHANGARPEEGEDHG